MIFSTDLSQPLNSPAPGRRLQFGLSTLLVLVLVGGPLLAWVLMQSGVGKELTTVVPCSGKVTLVDGTPVVDAGVTFKGPGTLTYQCFGTTKTDGTFILSTFVEDDGVPPGTYQVTVDDFVNGSGFGAIAVAPNPPSTAPITVQVTRKGKNFLHIVVK